MYAIKEGYVEREIPAYFPDESPIVHQPDVYEHARQLAIDLGLSAVVDVGCGRAGKLATLHEQYPDWRFVGIDYGPNMEWCRETYAWGEWLDIDLDQPHSFDASGAVLVSADVIEHLRWPLHSLEAIRASGCSLAVLSTPERDLTWGTEHNGPPPNPCHVREWNLDEFRAFLEADGFTVEHIGLTRTDDAGTGDKTILAVVAP